MRFALILFREGGRLHQLFAVCRRSALCQVHVTQTAGAAHMYYALFKTKMWTTHAALVNKQSRWTCQTQEKGAVRHKHSKSWRGLSLLGRSASLCVCETNAAVHAACLGWFQLKITQKLWKLPHTHPSSCCSFCIGSTATSGAKAFCRNLHLQVPLLQQP